MIQIKENIISKDKLRLCKNWLEGAKWRFGWLSNSNVPFGHWNADISKTAPNNPTDIANKLPKEFKDIWDELNKDIFNGQGKLTRCYANRHTFGTEGYIHTDSDRKEDHTVVIYLNENWHYSWGGETMFYENKEVIKGVVPIFGRVVIFPGHIEHCVKALTRVCPEVRTTLMYKVTIDPKAVYSAEVLLDEFLDQVGANKLPHKDGNLKDHLIRTFHILKMVQAADILALAGGLHSIYSTNKYRKACLPLSSTLVEDTFGPEVDRIVRLFSSIDRPNILENPDGSLSDVDLFVLRSVECANLYDQNELDEIKYPNLVNFIKTYKLG